MFELKKEKETKQRRERKNRQRVEEGPISEAPLEYSVSGLPVEQKPLYFLP